MIQIEDSAHVLSPVSLSILRASAARWPFDARVVISNRPATQADADAAAHNLAGKGTVGIALNPQAQLVGVDLSGLDAARAGRTAEALSAAKPYLSAQKWAMAVRVIGFRAAGSTAVAQAPPEPRGHVGAIGGAAVGLAIAGALLVAKRRKIFKSGEKS